MIDVINWVTHSIFNNNYSRASFLLKITEKCRVNDVFNMI